MRAVRQRVVGELLSQEKKNALILRQLKPAPEADNVIILRYALVTRGRGDHIFPAFVLDDWGQEKRSLKLFQWIRENGDHFPRAEIFGFEADGRDTQAFLREMELQARYPCYAYPTDETAVNEGRRLSAVLLPDSSVNELVRIKTPPDLALPLSAARVTWWQIPEGKTDIDLNLLKAKADPGY